MSEDQNNPPLDDYGIDHDRLLELCEKIIEITHKKYVVDQHVPKNASELKDVADTIEKVWNLTMSIFSLDDLIRSAMIAGSEDTNMEDFTDEDNDDLV